MKDSSRLPVLFAAGAVDGGAAPVYQPIFVERSSISEGMWHSACLRVMNGAANDITPSPAQQTLAAANQAPPPVGA